MEKTAQLVARMTPVEKTALALIADRQFRRPSEAVRELIRQEAARLGVWSTAIRQAGGDYAGVNG